MVVKLAVLSVQVMQLDLSSLASIRRFAEAWKQRGLPLHALINNAGIFSMSGKKALLGCCCTPLYMLLYILSSVTPCLADSWHCDQQGISHLRLLCARPAFPCSILHSLHSLAVVYV